VIDLHSHLLPGVDDGSRSLEQSVAVLRRMVRHGVTDVCLTPHLLASQADEGVPAEQDAAFRALSPVAPSEVRLHRGAEVMLDRPLSERVAAERKVTLGGTRYILVEFPHRVTAETVYYALSVVKSLGLVPVLAHPERYASCRPQTVRWWKETGALMQVDATTLLSSSARGERARELLRQGLGDILAADNHGDKRTIDAGFQAVVSRGGAAQADLLATQNPRAILDDQPTQPVPPVKFRSSIAQRVRRLFDPESL
jgi:protein-tyrosine phosphatase